MPTTTGSTVLGLIQGLNPALPITVAVGSMTGVGRVLPVVGTPNNVVTGEVQSGLAIDVVGREFYMAKTAAGSTWIHLVSGT
jgi:hypothetical protein